MLALILDSLGSTELLFILVIALMFFGPRKLPQLSRSLGKSLAEFRKASDDFKRTWEREVELETARVEGANTASLSDNYSAVESERPTEMVQEPSVAPIPADRVIARRSSSGLQESASEETDLTEHANDVVNAERLGKRDWL